MNTPSENVTLPEDGKCPYCEFHTKEMYSPPNMIAQRNKSLSAHVSHNHPEHYGHMRKKRPAGNTITMTRERYAQALTNAQKKERNRIITIADNMIEHNRIVGWKAAHKSGSNAGAGHVIGYKEALEELKEKVNQEAQSSEEQK